MDKIYVHDGREVVLTGKSAEKKLRSGKTDTVVQIKAANPEDGSFTKWVRMNELFEIVDGNGGE